MSDHILHGRLSINDRHRAIAGKLESTHDRYDRLQKAGHLRFDALRSSYPEISEIFRATVTTIFENGAALVRYKPPASVPSIDLQPFALEHIEDRTRLDDILNGLTATEHGTLLAVTRKMFVDSEYNLMQADGTTQDAPAHNVRILLCQIYPTVGGKCLSVHSVIMDDLLPIYLRN